MIPRTSRGPLLAAGIVALLFLTQAVPIYNRADSIGYYAYLRSPVMDGDFHFLDEYREMGMQPEFLEATPTGLVANPFAAGAAVLWLPFFLLAHLLLLATGGFFGRLEPGGYGGLYYLSISLATLTYAAAGIALTIRSWRLAGGAAGDRTGIAWTAAAAGTPVLYYALRDPVMPHALSFFAVALAMCCWLEARDGGPSWFRTGWALGLAATIRTQNVLFLVWPAADLLATLHRGERRRALRGATAAAAGFVLGFLPQMVVWTVINGGPLTTREGLVSLEWVVPRLGDLLLSPFHGLFLWSPVLAIGLLGLLLLRGRPGVACLAAAGFALQALVNGVVKVWWGGVSFGHRQFLNTVPGLALGMAAVARTAAGRIALALGTVWGLLLFLGLGRGQVWLGAPYTLGQMVSLSLRNVADGIGATAFWLPSLVLPLDLRLASIALLLLTLGAAAIAARVARRIDPWTAAVAAVAAVALAWGAAGVRTAQLAPSRAAEVRAATAQGPGVEVFIASTSKGYDALYALQAGDLPRAERDLRAAAAAWPADPGPLRLLASVFRRTGREALAQGAERLAASGKDSRN